MHLTYLYRVTYRDLHVAICLELKKRDSQIIFLYVTHKDKKRLKFFSYYYFKYKHFNHKILKKYFLFHYFHEF